MKQIFNKVISKVVLKEYVIAFLLGSLTMLSMLSYSQIFITGKYSVFIGDSFDIYIPTIRQFVIDIIEKKSIFYSWSNSFGNNTTFLNAFTVYNPFNILFFVFNKCDYSVVLCIILILKSGLISLCFYLYAKFYLKCNVYVNLLFSVMYAMCSYNVDSGVINFMWMDALYMLPIVVLFIHYLIDTKRIVPLSLAFAYLFITNFYLGYMVAVFATLYFIICVAFESKNRMMLLFLYFLASFVGILISGIVWVPVIFYLVESYTSQKVLNYSLKLNLFEFVSQFFIGKNVGPNIPLPDLYVGVLSIVLFPQLFINKIFDLKNKVLHGVLFVILAISCFVPILSLLWHGFDVPDGWTYRFSFLLSFVVCSGACIVFGKIKDIKTWKLSSIGFLLFVFNLIGTYFQFKKYNRDIFGNAYLFAFINLVFFVFWIVCICILKNKIEKNMYILLILVASFEIVLSAVFAYIFDGNKLILKDSYTTWNHSVSSMMDKLSNDDDFYRIEYSNDLNSNSGMMYGYNSMDYFSSSENVHLRDVLMKLGAYTSPRIVHNYSNSEFIDMIMGVKYLVKGVYPFAYEGVKYDPEIVENDLYLSLGIVVDDDLEKFDFKSENAFENTNDLASSMIGREISIFDNVDKDNIVILSDGIELYCGDGFYILEDESQEYDGTITFGLNCNDDYDYYFYMDNITDSIVVNESMLYMDGPENSVFVDGYSSVSYIKKFIEEEGFKYIKIGSNVIKKQAFNDYFVTKYNRNSLIDVHDYLLKSGCLRVENYGDGYVDGSIDCIKDSSLLFLSIPYDVNWKAYVDGQEVPIISLVDDSFLGLRIDGIGKHNVVLKYYPKGLVVGLVFSCIGVFMALLLLFFDKKNFIKN